jgi:ferritin-like metal-binding protein YciE
MNVQSLKDAFVEELRDVLSAERQLIQALPKMAKSVSDDGLRQVIEDHLSETRQQVERVEQVFDSLDMRPRAKKCEGLEGILEEGKEHLRNGSDPETLDAILFASCQKVEHYEIATYGSLCAWAEQLGLDEAAKLLRKSLDEEKNADRTLSMVAESRVNRRAESGMTRESTRERTYEA